jgi:hypothetical protein
MHRMRAGRPRRFRWSAESLNLSLHVTAEDWNLEKTLRLGSEYSRRFWISLVVCLTGCSSHPDSYVKPYVSLSFQDWIASHIRSSLYGSVACLGVR